MSETDWIHCNICYHIFDQELKMYILSCFHVICRNCMKNSDNGKKCPLCAKTISFKEIGKSLDPKLKEFFCKDASATLDIPGKILNFQKRQRENLVKYINSVNEKNHMVNNVREQMKNKFVEMHSNYQKIRQQRRLMQEKLRVIHGRQPQVPVMQQRYHESPPAGHDISFERAFTANGSGSSRGLVFDQPMDTDVFASPFSTSSGYQSQFP